MTVAINGQVVAAPVPQSSTLSLSRDARLTLNVTGNTHPTAWSIVIGSAATTPATFAALTNPQTLVLGDLDRYGASYVAATTSYSQQMSILAVDLSAFSAGDHLWMCYFGGTLTPSGALAPDGVIDLGVLAA